MYQCPHCHKTIGLMPAKDVNGKNTKLPQCPRRKQR